MIGRLRDRLTYANVMATIAVFVALGGSSYAALSLPRNSVGSAQIKTNAVRSIDVRNRSLGLTDLSRRARAALRGQQGPAGPAGPAGQPAAKLFAAVAASGALVRGNATSGGNAGSTGNYVVGFAERVSGCVYSATLGTTDASTAPAGRVTVRELDGRVGVQTYDASGTAADLPFHLIVAC
ncbi:MAG TPA: hypothetical protein VF529_09740 [Solirubrobacteraceae bacterium]|jgi:hypothetical protein